MIIAVALFLVHADVPDVVTLGALLEQDGAPVDRTVAASFVLWDDAVAGSPVWSESAPSLLVVEGLLVVELGAAHPLPLEIMRGPLWLEVVVDGQTLEPRTRLAAAPYARAAAEAAALAPGAHVGYGALVDVPPALDALATGAGVPLFLTPPGCAGAGTLTLASQCASVRCGSGTFTESCDGACRDQPSVTCNTSPVGFLAPP